MAPPLLLVVDECAPDVPFVVMCAENCGGDFCDRIRPVLADAYTARPRSGPGRYVAVDGAGHQIHATHLDRILAEIDELAG